MSNIYTSPSKNLEAAMLPWMRVALGKYIGPWRGCQCWARVCNNTVKGLFYSLIPKLADPFASPAFATTNECVSQSRADFHAHAKSGWWLWRGSRSNVTLRRFICSDIEPRYGWWERSIGYDWPAGIASSVSLQRWSSGLTALSTDGNG